MRNQKAQSTLEYAVIVLVIVAGLVAMQNYMRRAAEGKLRESSDRLGEQYSAGNTVHTRVVSTPSGMQTKETFGLDETDGTTRKQGLSHYEITAAQPTKTYMKTGSAVGEAKSEQITIGFDEEQLFKTE